ncbi:hypothetical protein SF06_21950 [Pseudomonas flexibilis]|nr:hypothetical protein SF06_21950 [Pseudomonas flexibilis]
MNPPLDDGKTTTQLPIFTVDNNRRLDCRLAKRVFSAIFIARQIMTRLMAKGLNSVIKSQRRG